MHADDLSRVHGMNERISIEDLALSVRAYAELLQQGGTIK